MVRVYLILLLTLFNSTCQAKEKLVISTVTQGPLTELATAILSQAYDNAGLELYVVEMPAARSLIEANKGRVDGELMRFTLIEKNHPNLIRVSTPFITIEGVTFSIHKQFEVTGWQSLKPYKIGILRGSKFAEQGTKGLKVTQLHSYEKIIEMLQLKRLDVMVAGRINGLTAIKSMGASNINILPQPLLKLPTFHYLHQRHKSLAPKIAAALEDMHESGRIKALYNRLEQQLLNQSK